MSFLLKNTVATIFILLLASCSSDKENLESVDITLAAEMSLLPTTVWVAESLDLFKKHHINLTIKEFDSGRNALEAMIKDKSINISTVAQTPIVFNSFNNEPYTIVATMAYSLDDIKVLARKDHGVFKAEDLRGKKIGATIRSTGHYFLDGYLAHYGMSLSDVNVVDINASKLGDNLKLGEVDAITSWEPHIHNIKETMGKDQLSLLISPTPFRKDFFFTTHKQYAQNNKQNIKRFLAALIEAEIFIKKNPEKSKQIVAQRLNSQIDLINRIWPSFTFSISLDQSILVNLEDEAIWAIGLSKTNTELPNYLEFIDIQPLSEIKPHAVNLIH